MTDERLAEIRKRCEAAMPGPWEYDDDSRGGEDTPALVGVGYDGNPMPVTTGTAFWSKADFVFIANAREDVPDLLAEIDRLKAELDVFHSDPGGYLAVGGIVTAEREACAKMVEGWHISKGGYLNLAEAIRNRGRAE